MTEKAFTLTSHAVAAAAGCTGQYVSNLAKQGILPHATASNGVRLYSREAIAIAKRLKAEGLARRGNRSAI